MTMATSLTVTVSLHRRWYEPALRNGLIVARWLGIIGADRATDLLMRAYSVRVES